MEGMKFNCVERKHTLVTELKDNVMKFEVNSFEEDYLNDHADSLNKQS